MKKENGEMNKREKGNIAKEMKGKSERNERVKRKK